MNFGALLTPKMDSFFKERERLMETSIVNKEDFYNPEELYPKSNLIISSKYKSTINENKIMAIALSKLKSSYQEDAAGQLIVTLSASNVKEMLDLKGGSFYDCLDNTARRMTGRVIGVSDRESKRFIYVPLITKAEYDNGVFTIRFVSEMKKYLINMSSNYTLLNLNTVLNFRSNYSFRLYEVLKSRCYNGKYSEHPENNKFQIEFLISELKLEMGVVNPEVGAIKTILMETGKNGTPDYDRAVAAAKDQQFEKYSAFRRECLEVAIKEINEKTELRVSFTGKKINGSRKINQISFMVEILPIEQRAAEENDEVILDEENIAASSESGENISIDEGLEILDQIYEVIEEKIKPSQASQLARAAGYDIEKIKKAYRIAKSTPNVNNLIGFMTAAIKNNYDEPIGKKKKNQFEDFPQRHTDYDELFKNYDVLNRMMDKEDAKVKDEN